jgi:hypothetical protein
MASTATSTAFAALVANADINSDGSFSVTVDQMLAAGFTQKSAWPGEHPKYASAFWSASKPGGIAARAAGYLPKVRKDALSFTREG